MLPFSLFPMKFFHLNTDLRHTFIFHSTAPVMMM